VPVEIETQGGGFFEKDGTDYSEEIITGLRFFRNDSKQMKAIQSKLKRKTKFWKEVSMM